MKKNEIIKLRGNIYRVLSVKDTQILYIDCLKQNMPVWKNIPNEYESVSEEDLNTLLGRSIIVRLLTQ